MLVTQVHITSKNITVIDTDSIILSFRYKMIITLYQEVLNWLYFVNLLLGWWPIFFLKNDLFDANVIFYLKRFL